MQNNDPSKPTCRVVKRQGQRGARIHPRGCQVRAEVDLVPAELRAEGIDDCCRRRAARAQQQQIDPWRPQEQHRAQPLVLGVIFETP